MKIALAIIQNDLRQRRFIFGAAIVMSLIPFVCLAVPALRRDPHGFVSIFTNVLAFNFPVAVALGLGATMIGSDLTARRLSFYFSRPISARALWYGKLVSALITIYASFALVVIPGLLYTFRDRGEWIDRNVAVAVFLLAPSILLLLAHTVSMMVRSRSAWIAIDAAGLAITVLAVMSIVSPLLDAMAFTTSVGVMYSLIAALVVVLVLAGGWHLSRGRTDRLGNHIELSKFLWSSVALILLAAGGFVFWLSRATAAGLTRSAIYAAPSGDWILLNGQMPYRIDYRAAFLVNIRDGHAVRLPVRDADFGAFTFSRDGKTVAWTHSSDWRDRRGEVWTRRLDPIGPANRTSIPASQWAQMVLSDDGSRLATFGGGDLLNVADAVTGRSIASVRIPLPSRPAEVSLYFVTPDVVRLYVASGNRPPVAQDLVAPIYEFDVRTRSLQQTGAFQGVGRWMSWTAMPDGQTVVLSIFNNGPKSATTCRADARTGACRSELPPIGVPAALMPLADGSLVHVLNRPDGSWLLRSTGAPPVRLAKSPWAYLSTTSDMKAVAVAAVSERERGTGSGYTTAIVDASSGRVAHVIGNVKAARRHPDYEDDPRMAPPGASNLVAAIDRDGHLVRLDVNTGAVTPLPR